MKVCYKCGEEKSTDAFYKNKSKYDGLDNRCKSCKTNYHKDTYINGSKSKYYIDNRDRCLETAKSRNSNNFLTNSLYKCNEMIRCNIRRSIKTLHYKDSSDIAKILGCNFESFFNHMQSLFVEDMYWSNHGEWVIDHILPISMANSIRDVLILNHYTNIQPLWKSDNYKKSKKLPENFLEEFFELSLKNSDLDMLEKFWLKKLTK